MANKPEPRPEENSSKPDDGPTEIQDNKVGWIDNLATRSTGLPGDVSEPQKEETPSGDKSSWAYIGLGVQFALSVALFAIMGRTLDRWFGWTPWGLVSLSMMAVIGNLYLLIKDALKRNAAQPGERKREGKS